MFSRISRRKWLGLAASSAAFCASSMLRADESREPRDQLQEPVLRVTKRIEPAGQVPAHPLDPALEIARDGLKRIQDQVLDYRCTIVKQERIDGELGLSEHMAAEIRNRKSVNGTPTQAFSVYLKFLKPEAIEGREVIYVEGANNGKMVAHEGKGVFGHLPAVWLPPDGFLAMKGQRYPITEVGIENLIAKLIEKAERDRKNDPQGNATHVKFIEGAKINGRPCTVLEVTHPERTAWFDFHVARVFIDDELKLPVRYSAHSWPASPGEQPPLEEAYTYLNLTLNVGLNAADFDPTKKVRQRG